MYSTQEALNRIAGTVGRTREEALNLINGTVGRNWTDSWNLYAGTLGTGRTAQEAANVKNASVGLTVQQCVNGILSGGGGPVLANSFTVFPATATRNDINISAGFRFRPTVDITVYQFGRYYKAGNVQNHEINLWLESSTALLKTGVVLAASASDGNNFKYVTLGTPIVLTAATIYKIASNENASGDVWKDTGEGTYTMSAQIDNLENAYAVALSTYPSSGSGPGTAMFSTPAMKYAIN